MSNIPTLNNLSQSKNWARETVLPVLVIFLLLSFFAIPNINDALVSRYYSINTQTPLCWLDYAQNYLMAKAILMGLNPYATIAELFSTATPGMICSSESLVNFPSPHPPASILLFIPFTYFSVSLNHSALIWTSFSLLTLA